MVVIHLFWLINQSGQLISRMAFTAPSQIGELGAAPDSQLTLSSVLFSTCGMSQELTPFGNPMESMPMHLIEMETHNIHIHETPTGLKLVLITDSATTVCPPSLWHELHMAYIAHALKNPFHTVDAAGIGQPIRIVAFHDAIKRVVNKYSPPLPLPLAPPPTIPTTTTTAAAAASSAVSTSSIPSGGGGVLSTANPRASNSPRTTGSTTSTTT